MSTRFPNITEINVRERLSNWATLAGIGIFVVLLAMPTILTVLPGVSEVSWTFLLVVMMCFAIAAMGFNVLLGYTGLLSFGHAAFFGTAAYAVALGFDRLGIHDLILLLVFAVAVAGLFGVIIGLLSLNSNEIYFALLTLALAQILHILADRDFQGLTQGSDGTSVEQPDLFGLGINELGRNPYVMEFFYYIVLLVLVAVVVFLWYVLRSPFGLTLKMIRENPERTEMIGVPVKRYRLYSFVLSAMVVGLAGALWAIQLGRITPEEMDWLLSGELVFITLLGGVGTFIGPAVGAFAFIGLEEFALDFTQYWHLTMGVVLLLVVLTVRERGVWGGLKDAKAYLDRRRGAE